LKHCSLTQKVSSQFLPLIFFLGLPACANPEWSTEIANSKELSPPTGFEIARTLIHLHTPYSYDACDKKGLNEDGTPNLECLGHFRNGLCANRVDFALLTDHPKSMGSTGFQSLLLAGGNDTLAPDSSAPIFNQLSDCNNGHQPQLSVGFEGQLMPVLMQNHLETEEALRLELYQKNDSTTVTRLKAESNALVFVPHTEKWSINDLEALGVDGIEIYNLHANLDPKIRDPYLKLGRFDPALNLLPYWIDPYKEEYPDLALLSFLEWSTVYAERWDALLARGQKLMGIGGCDSHENTLPANAWDGERLDSHRRLMRWVTHYILVAEKNWSEVRTALENRRAWVVFEGLGTPVGFNFEAATSEASATTGGELSFDPALTRIVVTLPTLHALSPQVSNVRPSLKILLRKIDTHRQSSDIVATSIDESLTFEGVEPHSIYRAEVWMTPRHLSSFLNFDYNKATQEFPWIITNPIWIN
jgi:hypothetical protein